VCAGSHPSFIAYLMSPFYPVRNAAHPKRLPRKIAVIGAGLAGASVTRALAESARQLGIGDLTVHVYDAASRPGLGASGVPVGIVHPMPSRDNNLASQFFALGVSSLTRWASDLQGQSQGWADFSGVDHRTGGDTGRTQQQPGGWVVPLGLIQACFRRADELLAARLYLNFGLNTTAADLAQLSETHDAVVVCTAADTLLPKAGLALQPLVGQVSWISVAEETPDLRSLIPRAMSGHGFLTPLVAGRIQFGATFHRSEMPPVVSIADHRRNIAQLERLAPEVAQRLVPKPDRCGGWAGIRHATRDRLPHIGQPICPTAYKQLTSRWSLAPSVSQLWQLPRHAGVHLLVGLGARGLSSAALGAEVIASEILGIAPDLQPRIRNAVDPGRFVLREHTRAALPSKRVD
jgi:tRNA 5-methylaminomethyl-2-thiouridine biosynthesis bifunctional protein